MDLDWSMKKRIPKNRLKPTKKESSKHVVINAFIVAMGFILIFFGSVGFMWGLLIWKGPAAMLTAFAFILFFYGIGLLFHVQRKQNLNQYLQRLEACKNKNELIDESNGEKKNNS